MVNYIQKHEFYATSARWTWNQLWIQHFQILLYERKLHFRVVFLINILWDVMRFFFSCSYRNFAQRKLEISHMFSLPLWCLIHLLFFFLFLFSHFWHSGVKSWGGVLPPFFLALFWQLLPTSSSWSPLFQCLHFQLMITVIFQFQHIQIINYSV